MTAQGEKVRVRLMLARMEGDTEPVCVGAIDETVWEHWVAEDEREWREGCQSVWGITVDTEWREVWVEFAPDDLVAAFATPSIEGTVAFTTDDGAPVVSEV